MLSFRESHTPEAQFPRRPLIGNPVNRGKLLPPLFPNLCTHVIVKV